MSVSLASCTPQSLMLGEELVEDAIKIEEGAMAPQAAK